MIKRPGRKKLQTLWTSFMDGPNTLKGWNELLDNLQTNNAFRKVNLFTTSTTSMTILYYHRYQQYNKLFRIIWMNS